MADTRIHGTTKRQVAAMFADERPHLRTLPIEPFSCYAFGDRVVHLDGFVEIAAAYYAPPPGWVGRMVRVQWDERHVRLLDPATGALLREHLVTERGRHRIEPDDRPTRTPPEVTRLLRRAHGIGAAAGAISRRRPASSNRSAATVRARDMSSPMSIFTRSSRCPTYTWSCLSTRRTRNSRDWTLSAVDLQEARRCQSCELAGLVGAGRSSPPSQ